jgi:membrane-associated HD superfamily phosphohydrolase
MPRPGELCILRRLKKDKISEEANADCTIVPLARFRLQLPDKVAREPGLLASLPAEAQKAAVELVQQLLVANTTFDAGETARRRKDTPSQVTTTGERSIQEGDVLVQARKRLTADDIYLLEQMYSLNCTRVDQRTSSQE